MRAAAARAFASARCKLGSHPVQSGGNCANTGTTVTSVSTIAEASRKCFISETVSVKTFLFLKEEFKFTFYLLKFEVLVYFFLCGLCGYFI